MGIIFKKKYLLILIGLFFILLLMIPINTNYVNATEGELNPIDVTISDSINFQILSGMTTDRKTLTATNNHPELSNVYIDKIKVESSNEYKLVSTQTDFAKQSINDKSYSIKLVNENVDLIQSYTKRLELKDYEYELSTGAHLLNDTIQAGQIVYTLHSEWKTYQISYNLNGGTLPNNVPKNYNPNQSFLLPEPIREGYEFIGWKDNQTEENVNEILLGSYGDKNYVAQWKLIPKHNISYNLNGGEFPLIPIDNGGFIYQDYSNYYDEYTIDYGECDLTDVIKVYVSESSLQDFSLNVDDNYINVPYEGGWNEGHWVSIPENLRKLCSLKLEYSGYDIETPAIIPYKYDCLSQYTSDKEWDLPTPTREGYEFAGWLNVKTKEMIETIPKGTDEDLELMAYWQMITYNISYDTQGGVLPSNSPQTYTSFPGLSTLPIPTKENHTFLGWSDGKIIKQQKIQFNVNETTAIVDENAGSYRISGYNDSSYPTSFSLSFTLEYGGTVDFTATKQDESSNAVVTPMLTCRSESLDPTTSSNVNETSYHYDLPAGTYNLQISYTGGVDDVETAGIADITNLNIIDNQVKYFDSIPENSVGDKHYVAIWKFEPTNHSGGGGSN